MPSLPNDTSGNVSRDSFKNKVHESFDTTEKGSSKLGILKLVFIFILAIIVIRFLLNSDSDFGFTSFLNFISEVPQVDMSAFIVFNDLRIVADWGIFNFFREFINLFSGLLGVVVFVVGGLIQAILFIVYFIRFIFLV